MHLKTKVCRNVSYKIQHRCRIPYQQYKVYLNRVKEHRHMHSLSSPEEGAVSADTP